MNQPNNRLLDDLGRLMTDAAGLAEGVRREAETVAKSQMERMMANMDVAREEDIEILRELIITQRAAIEALEARVTALEGKADGESDAKA